MPSSSFPKAILAPIPAFPQESSDRLLGTEAIPRVMAPIILVPLGVVKIRPSVAL